MTRIFEGIRKVTAFLLAAFLWLHAMFFLNIQPSFVSRSEQLLRMSSVELAVITLLVVFTLLAASGFWKTLLGLFYIYFFPFVLLWYAGYFTFLVLRAASRWLVARSNSSSLVTRPNIPNADVPPAAPVARPSLKARAGEVQSFLLRPFRRFMFLWCVLLVVTTHTLLVWLCLIVVLGQLVNQIWAIAKLLFFSPQLQESLAKIGPALFKPVGTALDSLAAVEADSSAPNELQSLWYQLSFWRKVLRFLTDPYLFSRWVWALSLVVFVSVYIYIAVLFSFAYYGIARLTGVAFDLKDCLVTSLFIPFFVSDLPKVLAERLLGGLHCVLVLAVGVGTMVGFLRRRLDGIRKAACDINGRFAEEPVRAKYVILEERFASQSPTPSADGSSAQAPQAPSAG